MKDTLGKTDRLNDRTLFWIIIAVFLVSCAVRAELACFSKSLMIYPDEIRYIDISRSIFHGDGILVHNMYMSFDQILYPIFLAPFWLIKNQVLQIQAIGVWNSVLMSSVLFPVFLLGRRIMQSNRAILLLVITAAVLPDLTMTATFMTENLFYPVSAWLIYFAFRFWDSERERDKLLFCLLCAFFCFLDYLIKIVSVYFIAAFALALLFDCLFTKKHTIKKNILYCVLFCGLACALILAFKAAVFLLLGRGFATYSGNRRLSIYDFQTVVYFFYAALFNFVFALTAFFYFPVILPLFRFKKLSKTEQNMLVFAISALLIMLAIITVSISLNEDYPKLYMRQHTRYYAPLLLFFLALFYRECFAPRRRESAAVPPDVLPAAEMTEIAALGAEEPAEAPKFVAIPARQPDRPARRGLLLAWTVFFCMAVFAVFRFIVNVCIDGVLLQGIANFGEKLAKLEGDMNQFHVAWQLVLLKGGVILIVALFTVLLFRARTRRAAACVFVAIMLAVSVVNNVGAMKEFKRIYSKDADYVAQAIAVNEYINKNDCGNVLVISEGYNPALDTYLTGSNVYWTKKEDMKKLLEGREYVDLGAQQIISNYPWLPYDLGGVDTIITDNHLVVDRTQSEEIELTGVDRFSVFRPNDPTKLYFKN